MPIDMPTTPADGGAEAQQPQARAPQDVPALKPNEIRLSKGRVATLREANLGDEDEALRLLAELGHNPSQISLATTWRTAALLCIESINGTAQHAPQTGEQLRVYRLLFNPGDGVKLANAYVRLNGLDDESFRSAG